jgi:hypothetical protein
MSYELQVGAAKTIKLTSRKHIQLVQCIECSTFKVAKELLGVSGGRKRDYRSLDRFVVRRCELGGSGYTFGVHVGAEVRARHVSHLLVKYICVCHRGRIRWLLPMFVLKEHGRTGDTRPDGAWPGDACSSRRSPIVCLLQFPSGSSQFEPCDIQTESYTKIIRRMARTKDMYLNYSQ